jgi:hypothetical protein
MCVQPALRIVRQISSTDSDSDLLYTKTHKTKGQICRAGIKKGIGIFQEKNGLRMHEQCTAVHHSHLQPKRARGKENRCGEGVETTMT